MPRTPDVPAPADRATPSGGSRAATSARTRQGRGGWQRLDPTRYAGPVLDVTVCAAAGGPALPVRALLDTGASHTMIDTVRVAAALALPVREHRPMRLGASPHPALPVHAVDLLVPRHGITRRGLLAASMSLPDAFEVLIGMDALARSRVALQLGDDAWWLLWEDLPAGATSP
jgi:hypothetical protein